MQWDELSSSLEQALKQEQSEEQREVAVVAQGLAKAATLLAGRYQWVITNVPYLARGKQHKRLRDYCQRHFSAAKNDLATVFLDRCLELCSDGGTSSIVLPQNWLSQIRYKKFRQKLLKKHTLHLFARLGPGAFETISGEVVKAILITLSRGNSIEESDGLFGYGEDGNLIRGVDVSEPRTVAEKAAQLVTTEIKSAEQVKQLKNPDARVLLDETGDTALMGTIASGLQGVSPADAPHYGRCFWELLNVSVKCKDEWIFWQSTPETTTHYGGKNLILWYGEDLKEAIANGKAYLRGVEAWGKLGIVIKQMGELPCAIHSGAKHDTNCAIVLPHDSSNLSAIWCFLSSPKYNEAVRRIDQSLKVTNSTLVKVPFDLDHWTKVAAKNYPNGLPKPYTNDPTQWIFHGHPCGSVVLDKKKKWTTNGPLRIDNTVLQVAVARLLGYCWPAELNAKMELADEQREWVQRCEALASYADEDGIICIPPVRGEASGAGRLLNLLAAAYGDSWSRDIREALLKSTGHAGKSLENWLRDKFFAQHCKLFKNRPFIWHIWDGLRDGFAALVNYHKLDHKLLQTLIYTYLGDWISRQKKDIASGVDGAEERLAAAENLRKKLELILQGDKPHDIFVRWKPLEKQPIGWNPDLNDGVRLNIRPFMTVPDVRMKGAGVLRHKPNIKWNKDRGKDVKSAPWYHKFNGDRINNHHLTLADKRSARRDAE